MAKVKKKAPGVSTTKAGGSSVVVVAPPATPAAPKKRGGGRRRKAAPKRRRGASRRRTGGGSRFGGLAASGQKHALAAWQTSQPQLFTIGGAAVAGLLQRQGIQVPKLISSLSTPANVGLIAWGAARFLKSPILDHLATGMLSVAAYGLGAGITIAGDESTYTMGDGYNTMGTAVAYDDYTGDDYAEGDEEEED
jgi:hypothetical protein